MCTDAVVAAATDEPAVAAAVASHQSPLVLVVMLSEEDHRLGTELDPRLLGPARRITRHADAVAAEEAAGLELCRLTRRKKRRVRWWIWADPDLRRALERWLEAQIQAGILVVLYAQGLSLNRYRPDAEAELPRLGIAGLETPAGTDELDAGATTPPCHPFPSSVGEINDCTDAQLTGYFLELMRVQPADAPSREIEDAIWRQLDVRGIDPHSLDATIH